MGNEAPRIGAQPILEKWMKWISTLSAQVFTTAKANSNSFDSQKKWFLIMIGKGVKGLGNFPKLSLYTQVQISVVSYFTGNRFSECSITGQMKWMEWMPEIWTKSFSLFINIKKKKKVNIRDRVVASQRNLHTKGGVPRAERCGTFINKHSGNSSCHAPLCKQK